jgi:aspartate/methionine/tyrosine aminotransferase
MLNEMPGISRPEPAGAFYAYPSVKGLLGRELRGRRPRTSAEPADLVLEEAEVALVPGEAFGTPGCFGSRTSSATSTWPRGYCASASCSPRPGSEAR